MVVSRRQPRNTVFLEATSPASKLGFRCCPNTPNRKLPTNKVSRTKNQEPMLHGVDTCHKHVGGGKLVDEGKEVAGKVGPTHCLQNKTQEQSFP
jgi:hypothetical protein